MKDLQDWITVNNMYKKGVKIKAIARSLGMSKNTVKRLIKLKAEPKYKRSAVHTKIDQYKEQIDEWYLSPKYDFIGTRIFRELNKLGYTGTIGPIYRYLKTLQEEKDKISRNATVRFETPMGDQAQFDWAEYRIDVGGELRTTYCYHMILSASRKKAIVFALTNDAQAIYEAIQELYDDLGGITRELLIDNPKALVIQNAGEGEVKFNLNALRLAKHLGIELNACRPYRARTKGKVEKPFQYIEEQFVKGNTFESMDHLNREAKAFINEWNDKVHSTTRRIPNQAFLEEIKYLLPLPNKRFMYESLIKRKVSLDSLVSIDGNKYSVPAEYADKQVEYRIIYGYKIEIFSMKGEVIKVHQVKKGKGNIERIEEDYAKLKGSAPKSIPEIKRQFLSCFKSGSLYIEKAGVVLQQPSYHVREILKLCDLYNIADLNLILDYCILKDKYRIEEIKEVLKDKYFEIVFKNKDLKELAPGSIMDESPLIRDVSYYEGGGQN